MHPASILPVDPSTPLVDLLRAAPPGAPCGVWIVADSLAPAGTCVRWGPGSALIVRSDLGALIREVHAVLVRRDRRLALVPSTVLALARTLEITSETAPHESVTLHGSPEEVLAAWRAEGHRVTGSRLRYGGR